MLIAGACSPKVRTVSVGDRSKTETKDEKAEKRDKNIPVKTPLAAKTPVISLILPLGLDQLKAGQKYTPANLKKANMSVEFYQGFKLALDSLTGEGASYKLQIFDSKDDAAQAHSLAYNPQIRDGDLIVGPIFPEDVKAFASVLTSARNPIVSPLSPASPGTFNNQNLITMTPPLEYHAIGAATYISKELKAKKVFILKSGFSDENGYASAFKKTTDSLSKQKIQVITLTIVRGNMSTLVPQLSATEENIFVVPSTQQAFLMVTLRSLDTLGKKFPVTVFGHPNWDKLVFLKASLLERLKTHITATDKVDYKAAATNAFLRSYRSVYHTEPTDFAIKGFDQGLYFGELLAKDDDSFKKAEKNDFTGLHNSFRFVKKPGQGWVNTHVDILKYEHFELKKVE